MRLLFALVMVLCFSCNPEFPDIDGTYHVKWNDIVNCENEELNRDKVFGNDDGCYMINNHLLCAEFIFDNGILTINGSEPAWDISSTSTYTYEYDKEEFILTFCDSVGFCRTNVFTHRVLVFDYPDVSTCEHRYALTQVD